MAIVTVPAQPVSAYNGSAHNKLTDKAVANLLAMFPSGLPDFTVQANLDELENGNDWADDWANPDRPHHFHDPDSHGGVVELGRSAGLVANEGMEKAIQEYNAGHISDAYFWVGFALHHVQDLTTPVHTHFLIQVPWHTGYEHYCDTHVDLLISQVSGAIFTFERDVNPMPWTEPVVHHDPATAFGWVDYAAHKSIRYLAPVMVSEWSEAADVLVPFAAQLTAGFLVWAYHQLNPLADVDQDGLTFSDEESLGIYDWDTDSDDDTLDDHFEANDSRLSPSEPDSDFDGMPDAWELKYNLNPGYSYDAGQHCDTDSLTNLEEYYAGTNPRDPDTDKDSMDDGWEVRYGLNPNDIYDGHHDDDNDGLKNYEEYAFSSHPRRCDSDGDNLGDLQERAKGTDPNNWDSDGDGWSDYIEVLSGTDPNNPNNYPQPPPDKFPPPLP
ncbi:MAG: hypothetical protein ACFFEV_03995 [Candidatus Thorarchaeota archaeon]